jgi:cytoskeletal protein CcmA (bactofilin family)
MSVFSPTRRPDRGPADRPARPGQLSAPARGLHITGEIESDGIVTIEGRLDGAIRGTPQVFVAPGGVVVGGVFAHEVVVGGRVEGDIAATARIELQAGAVVQGDVTAPRIVVHEGGEVNGHFRMQRPAGTLPVPADQLRLSA